MSSKFNTLKKDMYVMDDITASEAIQSAYDNKEITREEIFELIELSSNYSLEIEVRI